MAEVDCNWIDDNCDGILLPDETDDDGDGYDECQGDCDDTDVDIYPGADDVECDGEDTDCDGTVEWFVPGNFAAIQDALNAAAGGDFVCLSPGTYYENLNSVTHVTLVGMAGADQTYIDGGGAGSVVTLEDASMTIEGVTLQNGLGPVYYGDGGGGGVAAWFGASITLRDSVVTGCTTEADGEGGGLFNYGGGAYLENVLLDSNSAAYSGGAAYGVSHTFSYDGVVVTHNTGTNGSGLNLHGNGSIDNCLIQGNTGGTGALTINENNVTVRNTAIVDNHSATGYAGGLWARCTTNMVLENVIIAGNSALEGGGIGLECSGAGMTLNNTVVVGNSASGNGGGINCDDENMSVTMTNSVIAHNTAGTGGGIWAYPSFLNDLIEDFSNNVFWNNSPTHFYEVDDPIGQDGNLEVDPMFLDYNPANAPEDWDLHLDLLSSLIDAGDPAVLDPDGGRSDIGAYGGDYADLYDLDWDGYPEWWQPGEYDPVTYPDDGWDCEDRDADVYPYNGC